MSAATGEPTTTTTAWRVEFGQGRADVTLTEDGMWLVECQKHRALVSDLDTAMETAQIAAKLADRVYRHSAQWRLAASDLSTRMAKSNEGAGK